jgi:hypothetical protein
MSKEEDKVTHSERLHQKAVKIKRQIQLAKNYGYHKLSSAMHNWRFLTQPHRNHKKNIFNCGDPKCYMCMNPRRADGEETIQERKHKQEKFYKDVDNKDNFK